MKHVGKPVRILFGVLALVILIIAVGLASGALPSLGEWKFLVSPLAPPPSEKAMEGLQTSPLGTPVALPEKPQATSLPVATIRPTVPPPDGWPTDVPWPPPTEPPKPPPTRPPSLAPLGSPPSDQEVLYYVADNAGYAELHVVGMDVRGRKQSEFMVVDDLVLGEGNLVGVYPSPHGKYLAWEFLGDGYGEVKIMERSSGRVWCPLLKAPRGCWGGFSGWTSDDQFLFQPFDVPPEGVVSLGVIVVDLETGQYRPLDLPVSSDGVYSLARNVSTSPDGSRVIYSITKSEDGKLSSEIWTTRVDGHDRQLISRLNGLVNTLVWSPDGEQLLYVYQSEPAQFLPGELWILNADGSDARLLATDLPEPGERPFVPTWSPNGCYVAFVQLDKPITFDGAYVVLAWSNVYVVDTITGQVTTLSSFEKREVTFPTWSPDGRSVAFVSTGRLGEETLHSEVWVVSADGSQFYVVSETAKRYNTLAWLPPLSSWKGEER